MDRPPLRRGDRCLRRGLTWTSSRSTVPWPGFPGLRMRYDRSFLIFLIGADPWGVVAGSRSGVADRVRRPAGAPRRGGPELDNREGGRHSAPRSAWTLPGLTCAPARQWPGVCPGGPSRQSPGTDAGQRRRVVAPLLIHACHGVTR